MNLSTQKAKERKIRDKGEPHGVPGQCNINLLDTDSEITTYGKHNRLIVFYSRENGGIVEIREDLRGLPFSTEEDRMRVANGWQRMHSKGTKLRLTATLPEEDGKSIWYQYEIMKGGAQ